MAQLCLGVTSKDLSFHGRLEEPFPLLLVAKVIQSVQKHLGMKGERSRIVEEVNLENLY